MTLTYFKDLFFLDIIEGSYDLTDFMLECLEQWNKRGTMEGGNSTMSMTIRLFFIDNKGLDFGKSNKVDAGHGKSRHDLGKPNDNGGIVIRHKGHSSGKSNDVNVEA